MNAFTLNPDRHEPTDACAHCHCHYHHVDEAGKTYRECYECGHAYPTARALRREHRRRVPFRYYPRTWLYSLFTRADDITCCPLCAHDW